MATEDHSLLFRADVPDAPDAVAPCGDDDVEERVLRDAVHPGEVAVVMANHTIVLQVPALVFCAQSKRRIQS